MFGSVAYVVNVFDCGYVAHTKQSAHETPFYSLTYPRARMRPDVWPPTKFPGIEDGAILDDILVQQGPAADRPRPYPQSAGMTS